MMSPGYFPAQLPFHAAPNSIPMAMSRVEQATAFVERTLAEVPAFEAEAAAVRAGQRSLVSMCSKPPHTRCGNAPLLTQICRGLSKIVQCLQRSLKHSSPRGGVKAFRVGMILTWQVISYGLPSVLGTGTIALDMRFMPWMKGNRGT